MPWELRLKVGAAYRVTGWSDETLAGGTPAVVWVTPVLATRAFYVGGQVRVPNDPATYVVFRTREPLDGTRYLQRQPWQCTFCGAPVSKPCRGCGCGVCLRCDEVYAGRKPHAREAHRPDRAVRVVNVVTYTARTGVNIMRPGPWGNPFVIGRDGDRAAVVAKHDAWLATQPGLLARLPELVGQVLRCCCAPLACHGDNLKRRADALGEK